MKKFIIKVSYTILPIWLIFVVLATYIALSHSYSGDLGKLGFISFGHEYDQFIEQNQLKDTLFSTIDNLDVLKSSYCDILTIGDSFSQQQNGGFQNYLAKQGLRILNCNKNMYETPIPFSFALLNEGVIDSTNVKVVIIEHVERDLIGAIRNFTYDYTIENTFKPKEERQKKEVRYSLSRARDFILFRTGIEESPVYEAKLKFPFFSSIDPHKLYFYFKDVNTDMNIKSEYTNKLLQLYDTLCSKAHHQGIRLIFLVAVDKYDLYQNYIINNPFPRKTINEDLKQIFGDSPHLLLSKDYLLPLLDSGEKDVFLHNDTHWSYKASEVIAEELYKRISRM